MSSETGNIDEFVDIDNDFVSYSDVDDERCKRSHILNVRW